MLGPKVVLQSITSVSSRINVDRIMVAFQAFFSRFALLALVLEAAIASKDPTSDPFYQPPTGFESEAPGTILRNRTVAASFFGIIPDPVEAHQLLYRTTAINGSAISTVTTVFKPLAPKTDRFVSFHTAYDSSSITCTPSYQYLLGTPQTDLISSVEMLIIEAYLFLGYIVAAPDYEGPDAAFGPGHLEGMGVLDGMRAVSNYHETLGLDDDSPKIVGAGYSGGAIATGWAASLQPSYASELDIKGWVAGGTPSNLTGTLIFIDNTPFSGFIPPAIDGLTKPSTYGAQLGPVINKIIKPEGRKILDSANSQCAVADLITFFEKSLFSTDVQSLGSGILEEPTIAEILSKNVLGVGQAGTPKAPVFLYHASEDEIIPYANASTLRDSWCTNGANVKFTTFGSGGHVTTEVIALPDAINFVHAAFDGNTASGCSNNTELASRLNPLALGAELEPVLVQLLEALTLAGTKDENIKKDVKVLQRTLSSSHS